MRIPSFTSIVHAFNSFASFATRSAPPPPFTVASTRPLARKSMPTIPFFGALFSSGSSTSSQNMSHPVQKSKEEWQAILNQEQFRILREKGTEAPFSGKYDKHYPSEGLYACAGCGAPLYKADHKFKSGCGWPAFFDAVPGAITRHTDRTFGMERTEIVCSNCGGHLGHVFKGEGYPTPTDERHCVNSVSIKFDAGEGEGKKEEAKV
ncbi:methionine-R-sulfoxide reductase-like protein SelR [Lineolata rhizophorae]|uniref:Peptide-methionine (R)-S-oxide reductase n=1 Tax=Lineolata rhizophorae TaxID=578093 RepID=A0A6A6NME5_9PEZI|nr:methionine-R-sulfoxide reductase-like protein SelR [Lineolata rhizophorae]